MISNPYFFELTLPGGVKHEDKKVNYSLLALQHKIKALLGNVNSSFG